MSNSNEDSIKNTNSSSNNKQTGRWTKDQHRRFLQGLQLFGKNWKKIQTIVKTRNGAQIRSHAQKYFNKLEEREKSEKKQPDCKQLSAYSDYNQSKSYSRIDAPVGLPSLHFCFSETGVLGLGQPVLDFSHEETSMDHGLFSRPIEEFHNNRSSRFIEILEESNRNKEQSFMKTYVDVQTKSLAKNENNEPYKKKTSFVKFAREVEEIEPKEKEV